MVVLKSIEMIVLKMLVLKSMSKYKLQTVYR